MNIEERLICAVADGIKDVEKVIDVEGVKAKDAWDEEVDVMKYVLYTEAELTQRLDRYKEMRINESKNNLSTFLSLHPIQ